MLGDEFWNKNLRPYEGSSSESIDYISMSGQQSPSLRSIEELSDRERTNNEVVHFPKSG